MKLITTPSIRIRLTIWLLIITLLPLFVVIVLTYFQRLTTMEAQAIEKLIAIRDLKVQQLTNWVETRVADVHFMAGNYELRDIEEVFKHKVRTTADLKKIHAANELLKRRKQTLLVYEEIYFIALESGKIEVSTQEESIGRYMSGKPVFTEPLERKDFYLLDIHHSHETHLNEMAFSMPVFSRFDESEVIGVLVCKVNLNMSLYALLSNTVGLGTTGETLIVNKNGYALNKLRWYDNEKLNLKITAEPAVAAASGRTGITKTNDYRGEEVLAAYTFIPTTSWGFVSKQDKKELNYAANRMLVDFGLIFLISALVITILAFILSKSITKPIVSMAKVAQKMREGDLTIRNTATTNDELATLAVAFNDLADTTTSRIAIQEGIYGITETMIGTTSLKSFSRELLHKLMEISDAQMSSFFILNEGTSEYEHFNSIGANKEMLKPFNALSPEGTFGSALFTKSIYHLKDIAEDTRFRYLTSAGEFLPKEIITIPVIVEDIVVAFITLANINHFKRDCIEIIHQSWANINVAYSNLIASERTHVFADHLSRINQQLESQSEELQDQSEELQDQAEELRRNSEELQEQNYELEAQKKQVEIANTLKTEFLSNMSHELRTPLNSVMALSHVLIMQAKDRLNEEENNYLEIIERNGKRLLAMINDILDLSKIEAGKMEVLPAPVSIRSLLQMVKDNVQVISDNKGLEFTLEVPENMPQIETDEERLYQVILNIVANAVKFTEKGKVTIKAFNHADHINIEVEDTGIGISESELLHIFDEFRQADGSSSRQYEGTGLGLAIAKKITNILGGKIFASSKLGEGSVFTIKLPIKWYEGPIKPEKERNKLTVSKFYNEKISEVSAIDSTVQKATEGKRILLVDDNPEAVIQIVSVLKKENYVLDVASGGKEALAYTSKNIPDGIILDLMMPGMDGFEVLENIRSRKETRNIPVLILTAKDIDRNDLKKLSANHVQELVQKGNVDIKELLQKVKQMLGGHAKDNKVNTTEDFPPENDGRKQKEGGIPCILVIEDDPDNMTTIKAVLKGKYKISEANDALEALQLIDPGMVDLILMDVSLPKMDGQELIKRIRTTAETINIPVIAVTAMAMKGDKEKFLEAGFDAYVSKPIDPEAFLSKIEQLLG